MVRRAHSSAQQLLPIAVCVMALHAISAVAARAQQGSGATLPIDVTASPPKTLAGGFVTVSGKTGLVGANSTVSLRIKPPGAAQPVMITMKVGSDGSYSSVFSKTGQLGNYQVQVTAPDGKGQATTSFSVVAADVIPTDVGRSADSLVSGAAQVVQVVKQAVQALQASPERAEAEKRIANLEQRVAQLPAQVAVLRQQMQKVFAAREQVPEDNPQWDAYLTELDDWRAGAAQRGTDLRAHIKAASAGTQRCSLLDTVNESLTAAAEVLSYLNAPFDLSKSYWTDKLPGAFVARDDKLSQLAPEKKFAVVQTMKLGAAALQGPKGIIQAIPSFFIDLGAFLTQQEFAKYCQKFEGPLSATFLGESFTKAGEPFMDYTIQLDGKLVLMYEKSAPTNKPIGVLGYMEGSGSFTVRDNPKPIIRLTPGVVLFHRVVSPPGGTYFDEVGQASRSFLPHSFRVPVKGTLAGDSIVLALQPAAHDFGAIIEGRSIYVVMPTGGLVPQIIDSHFPLQKAHPILERAIRRHPVLHVSYAGGSRAEGTFTRDTTNADKTARVRTKITIKACNPGCLTLPLTPGKKP